MPLLQKCLPWIVFQYSEIFKPPQELSWYIRSPSISQKYLQEILEVVIYAIFYD